MARKKSEKTYVPDARPCDVPDSERCIGTNRDGTRCRDKRYNGTTVCRRHGAKGGRPITHGKYSKRSLALRERMQNAEKDLTLFNQQGRVAFLHALYLESVEEVLTASEQDPAELWAEARGTYTLLKGAIKRGDVESTVSLLDQLEQILSNGRKIEKAEEKARGLANQIAAISKTQYMGARTAAEMISIQEAMVYEASLIREILALDLDERTRVAVAGAITRAGKSAGRGSTLDGAS